MKKVIIYLLFLLFSVTTFAQNGLNLIPDKDKGLLSNLYHIMHLPGGTHKIYNGQGNSVFDVLYTIEVSKDKWIVYEGGTKGLLNMLYSVVFSDNTYRVHKGDPMSLLNIIYKVKLTDDGIEVYKGDSSFDIIYSYERER